MGYPACYPLDHVEFQPPAQAVLMDLDGTTVHSEPFWIGVIEQTAARLIGRASFQLEEADIPHVSGHSVSEHLLHCIKKYSPGSTVEEARGIYFDIARAAMQELAGGRGDPAAFVPAEGLKDFLITLKDRGLRIALVSSGLYEKAWPVINAVFRQIGLGDPSVFYDAIVTAGIQPAQGQPGTLGELQAKPHPWLYAEAACIGLGLNPRRDRGIIGIEDSCAGVLSLRLAGFPVIGIAGGNIEAGGGAPFLTHRITHLHDALPCILL